MRRPASPLLALVLAAAAAIAIGACGEEDAQLLPGGTAREITANLDTVERLADEGDCAGAESAALQVREQVEALEGVDPRLERALREGAERLTEVVSECEEATEAVEPPPLSDEDESAADQKKLEKEEEREQKEEEKEQKKEDGDEEGDDEAAEEDEGSPSLPPQAEGEGKGLDNGAGPDGEGGGVSPSGGVSPANPAGGD